MDRKLRDKLYVGIALIVFGLFVTMSGQGKANHSYSVDTASINAGDVPITLLFKHFANCEASSSLEVACARGVSDYQLNAPDSVSLIALSLDNENDRLVFRKDQNDNWRMVTVIDEFSTSLQRHMLASGVGDKVLGSLLTVNAENYAITYLNGEGNLVNTIGASNLESVKTTLSEAGAQAKTYRIVMYVGITMMLIGGLAIIWVMRKKAQKIKKG